MIPVNVSQKVVRPEPADGRSTTVTPQSSVATPDRHVGDRGRRLQPDGASQGYSSLGTSHDCGPCCQALPSCGIIGGNTAARTPPVRRDSTRWELPSIARPAARRSPVSRPVAHRAAAARRWTTAATRSSVVSVGRRVGRSVATIAAPAEVAREGLLPWDLHDCAQYVDPAGVWGDGRRLLQTAASCPSGYNSLGASGDCTTCCKTKPCRSNGCPAGSCGWKTDNCGESIFCGQCAPSCGAMGGDYCSQSNSCPGGYTSLGASSDCKRCCKSPPSCGAMGGNYCSQTGSCPAGYSSLGQSNDCSPCCVAN